MPIDDNPINALKHQFEMEDLSTSPVTGRVLQIVSSLPVVPPPLNKAIEWLKKRLAADAAERDRIMLEIAPPNNQNIMADYQNRYVLLPKGSRFVDLIKSRTAST